MSKGSHAVDIHNPDALARLFRKAKRSPDHYYDELFHVFWDDAYRLAYSFLNDTHDAEDVAQTALTRAFASLDTLKDPQAALKWVHRIVSNTALNYGRGQRRRMAGFDHAEDDISELETSGAVSIAAQNESINQVHSTASHYLPAELIERKEVNRIVFDLVKNLPVKQKQSVVMYYYAGLTISEIAADLETNENAVRALLFRARETLNARIREVEETQEVRLYSASALPLAEVFRQAVKTEVTPPSVPPKTNSAQDVTATTNPSSKKPGSKLTKILTIGTTLLLLAGAGTYLATSRTQPEINTSALAEIARDNDSQEEASNPFSADLNSEPRDAEANNPIDNPADDTSASNFSDLGSSNPSPAAPVAQPSPAPSADSPTESTDALPVVGNVQSTPTPLPTEYPRMPEVTSLLRFGTYGDKDLPLTWRVTAKTSTTMSIRPTVEVFSEDITLTSAQRKAIIKTDKGLRPTFVLDGHKLRFEFKEGYCYAW